MSGVSSLVDEVKKPFKVLFSVNCNNYVFSPKYFQVSSHKPNHANGLL